MEIAHKRYVHSEYTPHPILRFLIFILLMCYVPPLFSALRIVDVGVSTVEELAGDSSILLFSPYTERCTGH